MKVWLKRWSSVLAAAVLAAVMLCPSFVLAEEVSEEANTVLLQTAQGLTDSIIALGDDEIDAFIANGNEFTVAAMESWKSAKGDLGEKKEDQSGVGDPEISFADNQYTVVYPVDFEKTYADFTYVFDSTGVPTSLSVDPHLTMAVTLQRAGLNTLMGLLTVFAVLIFLSFLISLFKHIPGTGVKRSAPVNKAPAPAAVPAAAPVQEAEEELADDEELVAVIAAAIAAYEGSATTEGFVVRSIRKAKRAR